MNRTKRAFLNTVATILQMLVSQIISLVVSRKVLEVYGSDLNGVNAILSNMMEWILLLESGLTTASIVALFRPYVDQDYERCNRILSATKKKFLVIGLIILGCGLALTVVYVPLIKTDVETWDIFLMFTMMSLSTSFSVGFTRKYALLFNVSQSEYINTLITTALNIVGNAAVYIIAISNLNYLYVRLAYLLTTIATGIAVWLIVKKRYKFANYNAVPDNDSIKGTRDVVFQKLTGLIRNSAPLIFISTFVSTTFASVYSVYIFVYGFIRKLVMMVINATQSGIGQLIAQKSTKEVYKVFRVFEYTSTLCVCLLMSVAVPMTMPFVRFYTKNVADVQYVDYWLLFFIASNIFVQAIHIPSGTVINMSGKFKEDRNFQIISISVMLAGIFGFNLIWKTYGLLLGILIAAVVLAVLEIHYARSVIFKESYWDFFKPLIINFAVLVPCVFLQMKLLPEQFTILTFVLYGLALLAFNGIVLAGANYLFERERFVALLKRSKSVFRKG